MKPASSETCSPELASLGLPERLQQISWLHRHMIMWIMWCMPNKQDWPNQYKKKRTEDEFLASGISRANIFSSSKHQRETMDTSKHSTLRSTSWHFVTVRTSRSKDSEGQLGVVLACFGETWRVSLSLLSLERHRDPATLEAQAPPSVPWHADLTGDLRMTWREWREWRKLQVHPRSLRFVSLLPAEIHAH